MKRILFIFALYLLTFTTFAQVLVPKGLKTSTYTITPTEVNTLHGATSNIQSQLTGKANVADTVSATGLFAPIASPAFTGTPTAPTASVNTNTTQIATTEFVVNTNPTIADYQSMGMPGILFPMGWQAPISSTETMTSQDMRAITLVVRKSTLVTGYYFVNSVAGVYTASNINGLCLYSKSGSTYTKVTGSEVNDANLWTYTNLVQKPMTAPITLPIGVYKLCWMFSSSSTTTAPQILCQGAFANTVAVKYLFGANIDWVSCKYPTQTTFPAAWTVNLLNTQNNIPAFWLY